MNFTPGDPGRQMPVSPQNRETVDELNHQLGYDRPFLVRFVSLYKESASGDLGTSYRTRQPFTGEFFTKVPVTLKLGCLSFIVSSIVGISLGDFIGGETVFLCGYLQYDNSHPVCVHPRFFLGMVLIYVFGLKLGLLPTHRIAEWRLHPACADAGGRGSA